MQKSAKFGIIVELLQHQTNFPTTKASLLTKYLKMNFVKNNFELLYLAR